MANGIDQGALDANRKGRFTFLQGFALLPWLLAYGLVYLMGALCLYGGLSALYNAVYKHIIQNGTYVGIPIFLLIGGYIVWFAWQASGKTVMDVFSGRVVSIEGYSSKSVQPKTNGRGSICVFSVNSLSFQIPLQSAWEKLPGDCRVRAYYTPNSQTFINVEVLSS